MITRWPPHVTGDMPNKTGDLGQAGQPRLNNKLRGCRTTRDLENATCWDTKFWAVESDLRGRMSASSAPGALLLVSMRSYATVSPARRILRDEAGRGDDLPAELGRAEGRPGQAARAGGPWLCRVRWPSGLTAATVASGCRVSCQPQRCTAMRWWKAQSSSRLIRLVPPPRLRGRRWW